MQTTSFLRHLAGHILEITYEIPGSLPMGRYGTSSVMTSAEHHTELIMTTRLLIGQGAAYKGETTLQFASRYAKSHRKEKRNDSFNGRYGHEPCLGNSTGTARSLGLERGRAEAQTKIPRRAHDYERQGTQHLQQTRLLFLSQGQGRKNFEGFFFACTQDPSNYL